MIAIIATIFVNTGINKDFAGYIISALSIFIGLNISLIIMVFDKFNSTDFDTNNKTYKVKVRLLKHRNFFMQFTSLTAYSIILSLILIVLLSMCFNQHFTSSISISEKIVYAWEMVKTDWNPVWSCKAFISAVGQVVILIFRCITYYLLFYFIIILFYSILLGVHMHIFLKNIRQKRLKYIKVESFNCLSQLKKPSAKRASKHPSSTSLSFIITTWMLYLGLLRDR